MSQSSDCVVFHKTTYRLIDCSTTRSLALARFHNSKTCLSDCQLLKLTRLWSGRYPHTNVIQMNRVSYVFWLCRVLSKFSIGFSGCKLCLQLRPSRCLTSQWPVCSRTCKLCLKIPKITWPVSTITQRAPNWTYPQLNSKKNQVWTSLTRS